MPVHFRKRPLLLRLGLTACLAAGASPLSAQSVFINELHYDNDGTDVGERIEVAGPVGTDLTGWKLVLYNGTGGAAYHTQSLAGVFQDQQGGFGTLAFNYPANGIQNGAPDGLALVDPAGKVAQFLSYEGSFTAVGGPADGLQSTDIGVFETSTTPADFSLQLTGTGAAYADFTWKAPRVQSFGAVNADQSFKTAPPVPVVSIPEIQGLGHVSPWKDQKIQTSGIVTVVAPKGFYLQDAGDGNPSTSDAIYVFTSSAPKVHIGDSLQVVGKVTEYIAGGASTNNLSGTQIVSPVITTLSGNNALPAPVLIGAGGRIPPTEVIDDDGMATFDPDHDGIDFYESLEGMLVRVEKSTVIAPSNKYGEIYVVPDTVTATGRNARGGITLSATDQNPERLQLDDTLLPANSMPVAHVGDALGDLQGILGYDYGSYELQVTAPPVVTAGNLARETSALKGDRTHLSVSGFNVENMDPGDGERIARLAEIVVNRLNAPDILALQEVQDGNGPTNDGTVDAAASYQALITAISAAGGPVYQFRDIAPVNNMDGGEPGGNIRVGFLFRSDRVAFVDRGEPSSTEGTQVVTDATGTYLSRSPGRIDPANPAFTDSRKPLAGEFIFAGRHRVLVINNHFASKGGSSPTYGSIQPPVDGGSDQRKEQAKVVNGFVQQILAGDPSAKVVVVGDLNDYYFSEPLTLLKGGDAPVLTSLHDTLLASERYTYIFEGNGQTLDHMLVSNRLVPHVRYDIVHANAEFADQATDHDPHLALVKLPAGDLNGDGRVDAKDLVLLGKAILKKSQNVVAYDFNNNGKVDFCDIPPLVRLMVTSCKP